MTTYTIPRAGIKTRTWWEIFCPAFTAHADGFLERVTIVATGGSDGWGIIYGGKQYRNGIEIRETTGNTWLDAYYATRTRQINFFLLQGDVFTGTSVYLLVSFTYACHAHTYLKYTMVRTTANPDTYGNK